MNSKSFICPDGNILLKVLWNQWKVRWKVIEKLLNLKINHNFPYEVQYNTEIYIRKYKES